MKKFLFICLSVLVLVMFCFSPLVCFATGLETSQDASDASIGNIVDEAEENAEDGVSVGDTVSAVIDRATEYYHENKTEVLGLAGDAVIFVLALVVKVKNDKKTKSIAADLSIVKSDAAGTVKSQKDVVGTVNGMIDAYNGMKIAYEERERAQEERDLEQDERDRLLGAVIVTNTAILDMMVTVWPNSKNLPQGVKDMIMLKYANVQKVLDRDEELLAVVEASRVKISEKQSVEEDAVKEE